MGLREPNNSRESLRSQRAVPIDQVQRKRVFMFVKSGEEAGRAAAPAVPPLTWRPSPRTAPALRSKVLNSRCSGS